MAQAIAEKGEDPTEYYTQDSPDLRLLGCLSEMQKEYTNLTDNLFTQIGLLNDEILDLKLKAKESPPSPPPAPKPGSPPASPPPAAPSSKPPPAVPAPTWATVAKKNKKK